MLSRPTNISVSSGVYLFKKRNTPLYIGKAASLKERLFSYWKEGAGQKTKQLLKEATGVGWIETESEIAAFIKEAELIKKYRPKYNIVMRDDKNYFYVGITKEKFPRIFITHQPAKLTTYNLKLKTDYIGPFTSGSALKTTLKLLRKIFPYCTCRKPHKRPCLNAQIGRCLSFCCAKNVPFSQRSRFEWNIFDYQRNVKNVLAVLAGREKKILSGLKKEIQELSRKQKFEEAAKVRNHVFSLENVFKHQRVLAEEKSFRPRRKWSETEKNLQVLLKTDQKISRVEGYDISNISGKEATGSMVVFSDGTPDKKEYRQFRIKTVKQISDTDMLKEVIRRRLGHQEWPFPYLMLLDGGKGQLNSALATINKRPGAKKILIAALAKREEEIYLPNQKSPLPIKNLPPHTSLFLRAVRDEAHRFARKYHHRLRRKSVLF